jgi:tagatose 1,6-diphosphate aldolase
LTKLDRLRASCTERGVIAALAMDQRRSLRKMIAKAAAVPFESIPDSQLAAVKSAVSRVLSPYASALLLDPDYGLEAMAARHPSCGLLVTYEQDGFENPRPHRMLALLEHQSAFRLAALGAHGVKILLHWDPQGPPASNEAKRALIERIGHECAAAEIPFFLEPVVYDDAGLDFASRKPHMVIDTMREFAQARYRVDILKVEFPVGAEHVGGLFSHAQALDFFRQADHAAGPVPYIYLSAGVSIQHFQHSLRLAAESSARFSGVLCGRANWQDGIPAFVSGGVPALEDWLASHGSRNIQGINECLQAAVPWHQR